MPPKAEEEVASTSTGAGKGVDKGDEYQVDGRNQLTLEEFAGAKQTLTDDQKKLLQTLLDVNGQDAYSNEGQSLGRLGVNEYLILPTGLVIPTVQAKDVGTSISTKQFKLKDLAEIYVLNKAVAPTEADAIKYGMARMEAVKMGWVDNQKEIARKNPPSDSIATFLADLAAFDVATAREVAYLVPLAAEHVFRTTGHHYLSGQSGEYDKKYAQIFKACLTENVSKYQPSGVLYHALFHWISPKRVWDVIMAKVGTDTLPEAIALRSSSAPAGTAIITTMAAVIAQWEAAALKKAIEDLKIADLKKILDMSAIIKANPPKYHKVPHAYGLTPLSIQEKNTLNEAAEEAKKLCPLAQGFIDALFSTAALGNAKVFKKHADDNPIATKKAKTFFRTMTKGKVANLKDVFIGGVNSKGEPAKKKGDDDETEDDEEEEV